MSANTQTIRVRILPGVRMWQVSVIAAAIVLSLLLGLLIGGSNSPASAENTLDPRDIGAVGCTSHVPNEACRQPVEAGYLGTGHVPPGGFDSYGDR